MKQPERTLDLHQRQLVEVAIRGVAAHRGWEVHAINARSNHVHVLASGAVRPERMLNDFKVWATRRLAEAALLEPGAQVWARGGSRRYIWRQEDMEAAHRYVVEAQDDPWKNDG